MLSGAGVHGCRCIRARWPRTCRTWSCLSVGTWTRRHSAARLRPPLVARK